MTNEEAIGFLQSRIDLIDKCYPDVKDYREALIVAIKSLERDNGVLERVKMQEPCEDCISRQEVLGIVSGYAKRFNGYIDLPNDSEVYAYARGLILSIERNINAVPSVTPQPKVGEWLKNGELCKCSNCHSNVLFSAIKLYNYCYHCGARMEVSE